MLIHLLFLSLLLVARSTVCSHAFLLLPRPATHRSRPSVLVARRFGRQDENNEQAVEALTSLIDFHQGSWNGKARSFTVTPDVAAGILKRKTVDAYTVTVELGPSRGNSKNDFFLTETIESRSENDMATTTNNNNQRVLSLTDSHMDVDTVDASYSLDVTLPDFPSFLSGTQKLPQFLIEHCIAASDDTRVRCFALYGVDSHLMRVVVCEEERIIEAQEQQEQILLSDLVRDIEGDANRLVDRITGNSSEESSNNDSPASLEKTTPSTPEQRHLDNLRIITTKTQDEGTTSLSPHPVSLLELSSGVWLGDAIIRDIPMVPDSPLQQQQAKGFGTRNDSNRKASSMIKDDPLPFASWSEGVQKVAWRLMWNFGEEIRQINDFGKSLGAELAPALTKQLSGSVCVNEGLSRRIPADERMVYIDWNEDNVGFLTGSHSIQLPRYLNFDSTRRIRPFFTEFCTYQKAQGEQSPDPSVSPSNEEDEEDNIVLPQVVCSKINRVYNYQGRLKQGCSSFFTLKRFGTEM